MRVLIAVYPFLSHLENTAEVEYNCPFKNSPSADDIEAELIKGQYDGVLVGTTRLNVSIAEHNKALKVISRVGVGINNIDVEFFKNHGIVTTYTPFGPTDSTAEMALALMLAGTRHLINYDKSIRNGEWKREFHLRLMDSTVGIIGFGRIGKRLAFLLKSFGCTVLLHDIKPDLATAHTLGICFKDKVEILESCDIISFHTPLNDSTRNWLSYSECLYLKRPVTIINTARGGIVNEAAIYDYLKQHPESCYCCDVYEQEPYRGKLVELSNTLLTPHASSFTVGSRKQTELLAIDNCLRVLLDEPCDFIVEKNE